MNVEENECDEFQKYNKRDHFTYAMTHERELVRIGKDQALVELKRLLEKDPMLAHVISDQILLMLIGDDEITHAFDKINKWYA